MVNIMHIYAKQCEQCDNRPLLKDFSGEQIRVLPKTSPHNQNKSAESPPEPTKIQIFNEIDAMNSYNMMGTCLKNGWFNVIRPPPPTLIKLFFINYEGFSDFNFFRNTTIAIN